MSSSSSKSNHQWMHDVFLNFRGIETRRNFVSHLYASLSNAGINTFLDDEKLHKGTKLGPELLRAIEGSKISIVVFSKYYAQSSWCLNELVKIMECHKTIGQVVLPIFYDVDPSDVRNQKGTFIGEALELYKTRYMRMGDVVRALTEAANLTGWDKSSWRSESELVKNIVDDVLTKLDTALLSITDFPVGLESRVQDVIQFLEGKSSTVRIVGIWGMGGSGKTTIAKVIYNQIHRKFEGTSFLENIREIWEQSRGQIDLQKQLLSDILKTKMKIPSIAWGITLIEKMLSGKRSVVVLDDVNKPEQLDALCGNRKWFGPVSVIIITTRDARRLIDDPEADYVYSMKGMDDNESLELFSWHAFKEASPRKDFIELSRNVVAYCGGLPLALEVLGSYLYKRTKQKWKSVLSKLERIPNDQIQDKLRISFDGLEDDTEEDIFLDICCFFIGMDRAYVTEILNGCGLHADIGIEVLIERSLIKVEKNNKLGMHDLLRDMGREIVRESLPKEPEKRSRLWFHEDVYDVLTEKTGTVTIEGLAWKLQRAGRVSISTNAFEEMKKLRLLQLERVELTGDYGYLSKKLRWVCWQGFPLEYIPDNFYQGNLVAIDLKHSNLKLVWKEPQLLERLKVLNLSHSRYLTNTPDFLKLPNLEKLILKDCPSLSKVDQSIGDLRKILLINLKDCTSLSNLPRRIYKLKSLKTLILYGCSKIDKLEEDIEQMESLTTLIANNTAVKQVPFSIVRSKSIGYISLCGYEGLARDVLPSLIWSWMSPTTNPVSRIHPFGGMSSSLVSMDIQNNNLGNLLPMLSGLSKLRNVWVQCRSEFQLTQDLRSILELYDPNFTELDTSYASQISEHSLTTLLIGIGSYHQVMHSLSNSISQGLPISRSGDCFLPSDNYPYWLTHTGEGRSVLFKVPQLGDCPLKGMALYVVYSSILENTAAECLTTVVIVNCTKCTIQIYKRDTAISFNNEEWEGIISNLGPGDKVEIFVVFGHGFIVKKIAVYLIYDESIEVEIEPSLELLNVKLEPSPQPIDMKMEPSQKPIDVKMEPSPKPIDVKMEPSSKPKKNAFIRLIKRIIMCNIEAE